MCGMLLLCITCCELKVVLSSIKTLGWGFRGKAGGYNQNDDVTHSFFSVSISPVIQFFLLLLLSPVISVQKRLNMTVFKTVD